VTVRGDVVPGRSEPRTVSVGVCVTVRGDVVPGRSEPRTVNVGV